LLVAAVLLLTVLGRVANLGVEALWFQEMGALSVLTKRWTAESLLLVAGFLVAFAVLATNLVAAVRRSPAFRMTPQGDVNLSLVRFERRMPAIAFAIAAFLAMLFGSSLYHHWFVFLAFLKRLPYGVSEPIFGLDASFYLFTLPALVRLESWLMGLAVTALVVTAGVYMLRGGLIDPRGMQRTALRHLGGLGAAVLVLLAAYFALAQYEVLYSGAGAVHGAGFTDVHARLPGLRLMLAAALLAAGACGYGALRGRPRWIVLPGVGLFVLFVLTAGIVPSLVQKVGVEPNELVREKPYIENAIRLTREAWDLGAIEEHPYEVRATLDAATLQANRGLIDNIRLWDWRPLLSTYGQIQEIRLYYNFQDVDIDRYTLNGQYRQVMLSARELAYDQIPEGARTWVNLHLKYTHGYGLCMSPVNRITSEGLPELLIRDIPPVSLVDLKIERPEIYYGEQTNTFALVRTATDEFDYPAGDSNKMTRYSGKGGIGIGSFGRRLLFAWYLRSRELLFTGALTSETRILMRRNLSNRVPRLAPFLHYDEDPYLVIDSGKLYWVQDAYTASSRFPYSRPLRGVNYMRNSVKVVVDAYDGTTRYYVADPRDPLLKVYSAIFPGLFTPLAEMPAGLRAHLRYPEDLFSLQAEIYATYHMQDPQVYYNREDLWQAAIESQGGTEVRVDPYYTMLRLPGSDHEELVLMQPFTPASKDNMIAWIAARCDGEDLGKRVVYQFPKQALVYGPRQIEARIDQDPVISQQLTLWSQRGSSVIRGSLLVVPVAQSILYVEPLYLQAEKGALPELKRVIAAYSDRIEMGTDLETTLTALFGAGNYAGAETVPANGAPAATGAPAPAGGHPPIETGGNAARGALDILRGAQGALQKGDWAAYGREMERLQKYLESQSGGTPNR
jgi:hypothetical protein